MLYFICNVGRVDQGNPYAKWLLWEPPPHSLDKRLRDGLRVVPFNVLTELRSSDQKMISDFFSYFADDFFGYDQEKVCNVVGMA
jgi:hypothetical protein